MNPLVTSAKDAHSSFLKCESIKLLAAIYKHDTSYAEEQLSDRARNAMKESCSKVVEALINALDDSSLQKAKHRDEVLSATKHVIHYVKAHDEGILRDSDLSQLQESLKSIGDKCKSAGMKQLCSQVSETISTLPTLDEKDEKPKSSKSKAPKTPKSSKKKKSKK